MSQILTIEISDEAFVELKSEAEAEGSSPARFVATRLENEFSRPNGRPSRTLTDEEQQAANERFRRHFGEVNLGYAILTDNETLDEDIARGYADYDETQ